MGLTYTNIQHRFRKENNLSLNEYCVCDMIYHLSTSPRSSTPGWCYMSRQVIAQEVGLSKRGIIAIIDRMIDAGFLEKDEDTKFLKTTKKWYDVYIFTDSKEASPSVNNLHHIGEESAPHSGEESAPHSGEESAPNNNTFNNNTFNNEKDIEKEDKLPFLSLLSNSKEIFSKGGLQGVFFEKVKSLHSLNDKSISDLFIDWHKEHKTLGTEFRSDQHLKNSFNRFISKNKDKIKQSGGGGKTGSDLLRELEEEDRNATN